MDRNYSRFKDCGDIRVEIQQNLRGLLWSSGAPLSFTSSNYPPTTSGCTSIVFDHIFTEFVQLALLCTNSGSIVIECLANARFTVTLAFISAIVNVAGFDRASG